MEKPSTGKRDGSERYPYYKRQLFKFSAAKPPKQGKVSTHDNPGHDNDDDEDDYNSIFIFMHEPHAEYF